MPRYALKVEYDGKPYHGWQRQRDVRSVQQTIEIAISKIAPEKPEIQGAGRTDAGVHATGQIAHVDLNKPWDSFRLSEAINYHLRPEPISITKCSIVADDFHARFSAKERRYVFRLLSRRAPAIVDVGWVWQIQHDLDLELMQEGANYLVGKHDFTTFRSSICQAQSPIKSVKEISIKEISLEHGKEFEFTIIARSFLHNQVRSFIGTLERVGSGSWNPERVHEALIAKDRSQCGPVCPPHGLYLAQVSYDTEIFS
tara:strand:- start:9497 stop:10264 length:768 start_codon:yes stop_codon:yes gene_type:complete